MKTTKWAISLILVISFLFIISSCAKKEEAGKEQATKATKVERLTSLDSYVPSDAFVYVAFKNLETFKENFKKTVLWEIWTDPNNANWKKNKIDPFFNKFSQEMGFTIDDFIAMFKGDVVLCVWGNFDTPNNVKLALLIDMKKNPNDLDTLIETKIVPKVKEKIPEFVFEKENVNNLELKKLGRQDKTIYYFNDKGLYIFAKSPDEIKLLIETNQNPVNSFYTTAKFKEIADTTQKNFHTAAFIDIHNILIKANLDKYAKPNQPKPTEIISALGLSDVNYCIFSSSIKDKGFQNKGFVSIIGERKGIMGLIGENRKLNSIKLVSEDSSFYFASSIKEPKKIWEEIKANIKKFASEKEYQKFELDMASFETNMGFNLEEDLLAPIGAEVAFAGGGGLSLTSTIQIFVELKDSNKFLEAFKKLIAKTGITPQEATYQNKKYNYLILPNIPVQIAYGVVGDYFIISNQQSGITKALDCLTNNKNLLENPKFKNIVKELPKNYSTISYSYIADILPAIPNLLSLALAAKMGGQIPELPNFDAIASHLFGSGAVLVTEKDKIKMESYSDGVFDIASTLPMIGVASAIAIPNFIEAQGRSKVSRVQAELRSINTGLESYFVDWNKYPQRLEQMTTPIAYITTIFNDPFNTSDTYRYLLDSGKNSWKLYSVGPDKIDNEGEITYDPTNGSVSEGDIVREKQ